MNVAVDMDFKNNSVKSQMRRANKKNSKYLIIIGNIEIKNKQCKVRNLINRKNILCQLLSDEIKNKLNF